VNLDPTTTKYMIRAQVRADGVIEKPDVVGAVFGQTEGLLGTELDMRDLQKSARIGRIEVEIDAKKGKSEGTIFVPSSLDKVETAIIAAALESIDRVGPCKAQIRVTKIEDVRASRRGQVIGRAKELLQQILEDDASDSGILTDEVRSAVQVAEIVQWGAEKLPAGPAVATSDDIILVEGRNDVLNLLRCGIRNALSVEGTNVPKSIQELSKERVTTIFIDGDRGGELIGRELLTSCEVDFVARAPQTREVEELPHKLVMKALNNKMPAEQFADTFGITVKRTAKKGAQQAQKEPERPARTERRDERRDERREEPREEREPRGRGRGRGREREREREAPARGRGRGRAQDDEEEDREERRPARGRGEDRGEDRRDRGKKPLPPDLASYRDILGSVSGSLKAVLLDKEGNEIARDIAVRELADTLKNAKEDVSAVVFDGVITQRLLDIASDRKIQTVVGVKVGNVSSKPEAVQVVTKGELE
jgi:DNA primase